MLESSCEHIFNIPKRTNPWTLYGQDIDGYLDCNEFQLGFTENNFHPCCQGLYCREYFSWIIFSYCRQFISPPVRNERYFPPFKIPTHTFSFCGYSVSFSHIHCGCHICKYVCGLDQATRKLSHLNCSSSFIFLMISHNGTMKNIIK